jgi:uncharacterized protein DUF4189
MWKHLVVAKKNGGGVMRTLLWALAFATVVIPHSTFAAGASAIAADVNIAKPGWSYGTTSGQSEEEARAGALEKCRSSRDAAAIPALRKACVVTRTFHDQCVAIAMDPGAGTPGVGWAIAPTPKEAETQAIANCRKVAGPSR